MTEAQRDSDMEQLVEPKQFPQIPEWQIVASEREIKRRLKAALASTIVSLGFALLSWFYFLGSDAGSWFSRSGAVITILALVNEAQLSEGIGRLNDELRQLGYWKKLQIQRIVGLILAMFGALIWGYGDMIFNWS